MVLGLVDAQQHLDVLVRLDPGLGAQAAAVQVVLLAAGQAVLAIAVMLLQRAGQAKRERLADRDVHAAIDLAKAIVAVADPHLNRFVAFSDLTDLDQADRIRAAVGRLMLVVNSYQATQDIIKVSQPIRRQFVARSFQTADLSVVDVPASLFTPAAPTTQALETQFKKYANVNPEDEAASPYGYGYRFSDRVKLQ